MKFPYFHSMEQTQQQIVEYYDAFYDTEGFTYYPPEFTRKVLRALCAKAGVAPGARVLDVGCATGYYSAILSSLGYEVTGIDISETGIRKARERYPDIRFEVQDATTLPYSAGSFDFVFALGVSVANTRDLGELHGWLAHLMGVLAPGGILALLGGSTLTGDVSEPVTFRVVVAKSYFVTYSQNGISLCMHSHGWRSNVLSARTVDKSIQARKVMGLLSTARAASMRLDAIHAFSQHVVFQTILERFGVMG